MNPIAPVLRMDQSERVGRLASVDPVAHLSRTTQVVRVALLAVAALLALGTSKVLSGKELAGRVVAVPHGVVTVSGPSLRLWENVNNQGCFAAERLDVEVTVRLRNDSGAPLRPGADRAGLRIDGKNYAVTALRLLALGSDGRPSATRSDLTPGATGELVLGGQAILPKSALTEVDRIEAWVELSPAGRLRLEVSGIKTVPIRKGR